jgi:pimeloyl-ACP methyl ester carboxylesterase
MIASEKSGRGAEKHRGRSAILDRQVEEAMRRLLALGDAQAVSRSSSVRGKLLHYLEAGSGPALILLHGAGGGSANWYRLIGPLSRQFRVIAIDLPGFGLSESIEPEAPLGGQVAGIVAEFLAGLGVTPVDLVATSFGGLVALRLATMVEARSVVLIDSAGLWPEASVGLKLACIPFVQRLGLKQTRRGARWALRHVLITRRLLPDHEAALAEYIFASAARGDPRSMARGYALFGSIRGQSEVLSEAEMRALAPRLSIIWGEKDRFLPAPRARRAAVLAAGVQLRIIPGVGHSPNWEAPDEVLEMILEFLSRHR